jgi:hypothetical protein
MSQPPHTAEAASEPQDLAVTISAWMDGDDAAPMPEAVLTKQGQQTWQVYNSMSNTQEFDTIGTTVIITQTSP